jgi:hypothetical protein
MAQTQPMSTVRRKEWLIVIAALVAARPLLAHHDWPIDRARPVTVTGTVTSYVWANPHVTIGLDVDAGGTIEKWTLGGTSPKYMADHGWDKSTLKLGDVITGVGYRFRNGSYVTQLHKIVLSNGRELFAYPGLIPP